jgi:hypothetical protein
MLCHFDGDFGRDSLPPAVHCPNRVNQFFPQHALQKIAVGACLERSVSLGITAIGGQHLATVVLAFAIVAALPTSAQDAKLLEQ